MKLRDANQLRSVPAPNATESHSASAPSVDLPYLFSVLVVNLRLVLFVALACVAAMYFYVLSVPPTYRASASVLLDTREESVSPVREVVSNLDVSNSVVAGEVVTIQSNVLLGRVVDSLDLVNHPEFDPRVARSEGVVPWLKRLARGEAPPHEIAQTLPPDVLRLMVLDGVRANLYVHQVGVSFAIGVTYEAQDPKLAADIANGVANEYIKSQLEEKLTISSRANDWLSDRLVELSQQVEEADAAVVNFRAEMIERAGGSEESIAQLLAELNTRLVSSSTDRADAEVRLGQVETLLGINGLAAVGDVVTSPLLETLQRQRAELAANQAQMASSLGRKHPEMVRISAQIADLDRSIEGELQRKVEEMRSEVVVTRNREEALLAQIAKVSARADILARESVRLSQLERTAEATRVVYGNFLARYKETRAQADFQTPEARVIGRAEVPVVPAAPRKTLMMIAALGFGLSGAIAFVFLRNLLRSPVLTSQELVAVTGRPMLAMLPRVRNFGSRFDWLRKAMTAPGGSSYMEHVNSLRTALHFSSDKARSRMIVITSSVPTESKTSLSCALAKSFLNGGASILLLDADLRRPDVRRALDMRQDGGCLVEYLEGRGKLKDLVIRSELAGLDVVSPCRPSDRAADLLSGNLFQGLLTRMSGRYDFIVVNSPPVLHISDAVLLAKRADATIFAVRCGITPTRVVRNSIQRLQSAGVTVTGSVLTMVRRVHAAAREADMYQSDY